jgi:hypothetical protein
VARERYDFTGAAWGIIGEQPRLLRIPVLETVCGLVTGALIFGPLGALAVHYGSWKPLAVGVALAAYPLTFLSVYFNFAFVAMLDARIRGEDASVRAAFAAADARRRGLAGWAFLAATVGIVLSVLRHVPKIGHIAALIVSLLMQIAWDVVTLLVVPVLAFEQRGALGSVRRSASLFRSTWRQNVRSDFTLAVELTVLWIPVAAFALAACITWREGAPLAGLIVGAVGLTGAVCLAAISTTLWQTLSVGLYRHAAGLELGPFDRIATAFPPPREQAPAHS